MSRVAMIGLGAMGGRIAANLIAGGHQLVVHNRTAERTNPLADLGAQIASSPRQAAEGAEFVIDMVSDDEAARAIWLDAEAGALGGMAEGAVALECSTLSVDFMAHLAQVFGRSARAFLATPVIGSLPQVEAKALSVLAGGDALILERARPILAATAGRIAHVGSAAQAAGLKLAVNALFSIQVSAIAELLGMLDKAGLDIGTVLSVIGDLPVMSPALTGAVGLMVKGDEAPRYPIRLVDKDLRYLMAAASNAAMPVSEAAARSFAHAVANELGNRNISALSRLSAMTDGQRSPFSPGGLVKGANTSR